MDDSKGTLRRWLARQEKRRGTPVFDDTVSLSRLREGFARVRRNRGAAGADGVSVEAFAFGLERRLGKLRDQLVSGRYEPRPMAHVEIPKRAGKGTRTLSIPCVVDRVAQTAAHLAIRERAEQEFEDVSWAYRPGRSVAGAIDAVMAHHRAGFSWVVDADIRGYFDNVPHLGVMAALGNLVPERPYLDLVGLWLEGSRFHERGLPQGAPISPVLANLYLDRVDEAMAEAGFRLVRYADDFVILCRDETRARKALDLAARLLDEMGLALHADKTRIRKLEEGYRFLGRDIRRTTLARQLQELEEDAACSQAVELPVPERLDGTMGVPGSRRMLGKTYEPGEGPDMGDIEALDHPWKRDPRKNDLAEDDEPPPLEPADDEALRTTSRHAPFIRPLYLTTQGLVLDVYQQSAMAVRDGDTEMAILHPGTVDRIDIFPGCEITTAAMRRAAMQGTPVFLVDGHGNPQGGLSAMNETRASLHLAQAQHALDDALALRLARRFVHGRIFNARRLLQRLRGRLDKEAHADIRDVLERLIDKLKLSARKVLLAPDIQSMSALLGQEAAAAQLYWPALASLLRRGMDETEFRRKRLPADSPFNTVLNWTAGLLRRDIETLLVRRGVHPGFGVLHAVNDTRRGLVFDLMEEFRAPIAESLSVTLLSKGILGAEHFDEFELDGKRAVWLVNGGSQKVVRAYEKLVDHSIKNPMTGERTNWRGMMNFQVSAYINHVLGEVPYAPYKLDM